MAKKEMIRFTVQLSTAIIEHIRLVTHYLRREHGLSYSDYCTLLVLRENKAAVNVRQLADFLVLGERSVWMLLLGLEDKRLVCKQAAPKDKRVMQVGLSGAGTAALESAFTGLESLVRSGYWVKMAGGGFDRLALRYAAEALDRLRGHAVAGFAHDYAIKEGQVPVISADLLVLIRLLAGKWAAIVRDKGGLSFGEYRCLALLEELGAMRPSAIAAQLFIERSSVSLYRKHLQAKGLAQAAATASDGRSIVLSSTSKGRRLARGLTGELSQLTRWAYAPIPDADTAVFNAYFYLLYSNLRRP